MTISAAATPKAREEHHGSAGYQLLMLVLCIYALGVLAVQTAVTLRSDTRDILDLADYAIETLLNQGGVFIVSPPS